MSTKLFVPFSGDERTDKHLVALALSLEELIDDVVVTDAVLIELPNETAGVMRNLLDAMNREYICTEAPEPALPDVQSLNLDERIGLQAGQPDLCPYCHKRPLTYPWALTCGDSRCVTANLKQIGYPSGPRVPDEYIVNPAQAGVDGLMRAPEPPDLEAWVAHQEETAPSAETSKITPMSLRDIIPADLIPPADQQIFAEPKSATFPDPVSVETALEAPAKRVAATKICPECGETFEPRSNRQIICGKADCYRARQNRKNHESYNRRKGKTPAQADPDVMDVIAIEEPAAVQSYDPAAGQHPTDAELREAEAFEKELAHEQALETAPVEYPDDEDTAVEAQAEIPVPVTAAAQPAATEPAAYVTSPFGYERAVWILEGGAHAGSRMTPTQLRKQLINGGMLLGQKLRYENGHDSERTGQYRVVKATYPSQKLEKVLGQGAGTMLLASEI